MEILDILASSDMRIEDFFIEYSNRKKGGKLYSKDDFIPQNLIKLYYLDNNHLDFRKIIDAFKKKTVYNENEVELVHEPLEREGLALVYDGIESGKFSSIKSIYVILLIHNTLYSRMPNSNYGGKWRNTNAFITNTDVKTNEFNNILK